MEIIYKSNQDSRQRSLGFGQTECVIKEKRKLKIESLIKKGRASTYIWSWVRECFEVNIDNSS